MEEKFTEVEIRIAKAIKKTPAETREILKETKNAARKKREEATDLDFTKLAPDPEKPKSS
ncbi:MAG: hypothetical protein NUV60_03820 [Patescibacteria group bacterium]|nr:hypothetical protein [Patescibacteria group bacterium]